MSSKLKKLILFSIYFLLILISIIFVFLTYITRFYDGKPILMYSALGSYIVISVALTIIYWNLSKEFRVEKEMKRLKDINFAVMKTVLNYEYIKKKLLDQKYRQVDETTFHAKVEHNFGDPTWTDYFNIKVLNVDTINEDLIDSLNGSSRKGFDTYNLVLFMMEVFNYESRKNCIQYIKSLLISYRTSYLKNGKGYAITVYEKSTNSLYYYKDKSRLHSKYAKCTNQLLKLL